MLLLPLGGEASLVSRTVPWVVSIKGITPGFNSDDDDTYGALSEEGISGFVLEEPSARLNRSIVSLCDIVDEIGGGKSLLFASLLMAGSVTVKVHP